MLKLYNGIISHIQWYLLKKKTFINHSPVSSGVLFSSLHKRFVYLDIYLCLCIDWIALINLKLTVKINDFQPVCLRWRLRCSICQGLVCDLMPWGGNSHVLVGWGKSNNTEFPFDQTHAVCTCAPSQAVPYGETVKEACVIQQGLQDTALSVWTHVCAWKKA